MAVDKVGKFSKNQLQSKRVSAFKIHTFCVNNSKTTKAYLLVHVIVFVSPQ